MSIDPVVFQHLWIWLETFSGVNGDVHKVTSCLFCVTLIFLARLHLQGTLNVICYSKGYVPDLNLCLNSWAAIQIVSHLGEQ